MFRLRLGTLSAADPDGVFLLLYVKQTVVAVGFIILTRQPGACQVDCAHCREVIALSPPSVSEGRAVFWLSIPGCPDAWMPGCLLRKLAVPCQVIERRRRPVRLQQVTRSFAAPETHRNAHRNGERSGRLATKTSMASMAGCIGRWHTFCGRERPWSSGLVPLCFKRCQLWEAWPPLPSHQQLTWSGGLVLCTIVAWTVAGEPWGPWGLLPQNLIARGPPSPVPLSMNALAACNHCHGTPAPQARVTACAAAGHRVGNAPVQNDCPLPIDCADATSTDGPAANSHTLACEWFSTAPVLFSARLRTFFAHIIAGTGNLAGGTCCSLPEEMRRNECVEGPITVRYDQEFPPEG